MVAAMGPCRDTKSGVLRCPRGHQVGDVPGMSLADAKGMMRMCGDPQPIQLQIVGQGCVGGVRQLFNHQQHQRHQFQFQPIAPQPQMLPPGHRVSCALQMEAQAKAHLLMQMQPQWQMDRLMALRSWPSPLQMQPQWALCRRSLVQLLPRSLVQLVHQ